MPQGPHAHFSRPPSLIHCTLTGTLFGSLNIRIYDIRRTRIKRQSRGQWQLAYRMFQLDFTQEMEVFYMMFQRYNTKNRKISFKQRIQYFNFRSKIQLNHPVHGPIYVGLQVGSVFWCIINQIYIQSADRGGVFWCIINQSADNPTLSSMYLRKFQQEGSWIINQLPFSDNLKMGCLPFLLFELTEKSAFFFIFGLGTTTCLSNGA